MALEALGVASSVIAVLELSGRVTAICFKYSRDVKNAREEINRLLTEVNSLRDTTRSAQELLESPEAGKLRSSKKLLNAAEDAQACLSKLDRDLAPSSTRKVFARLGLKALKWPLKRKHVNEVIQQLGRCAHNISFALQVDQTAILLDLGQKAVDLDQKAVLGRLPRADGAAHDSLGEVTNPTCLTNTRVSLLDEVAQWVRDPSAESLFWLNGMAGTGKSTIARTVAKTLCLSGHLGASFFFKRGEADRDSFHKFFTTLAAQLVVAEPGTATNIKEAIDADPAIFQKGMQEQFDKLIAQPLTSIDPSARKMSTLVILIDALDECVASTADIRRAVHILSYGETMRTPQIRIFITSRPEFPIRMGFRLAGAKHKSVALQDLPENIIQRDIKTYLDHQLTQVRSNYNLIMPKDRHLPLMWPSRETIHALVEMATPLFIFAATACRSIADPRWHPDEQLAKILRYRTKSQQSKLDATYCPVLDSLIEGLDKEEKVEIIRQFRNIVGPVVILARPLSVVILAKVLDIPKRIIEQRLDGLHSVLHIPQESDAPVRLLHLSFRDFLLDPDKEHQNPFWVNEQKTHARMAAHCLRLMNAGLRKDICDLKDPSISQSSVYPGRINECISDDLQYACVNWVMHLKSAQQSIQDDDEFHAFLKNHLLHWIEVLSLMGIVRRTIRMINGLKDCVRSENSTNLSALLEDAYRLIMTFMSTINSFPLQLYSSVLLFAPTKSAVRKLFLKGIPSWISSCQSGIPFHLPKCFDARHEWNSCLSVIEGHDSNVTSMKFFTSGERLVSASIDKKIKIWDVHGGECLQVIGCPSEITSVALSRNDGLLLTCCSDRVIRVWDLVTEQCVQELKGSRDGKIFALFSEDSNSVAYSAHDKTIGLCNLTNNHCTQLLDMQITSETVICLSRDFSLVASVDRNGVVSVRRKKLGNWQLKLEASRGCEACVFSPDASLLAAWGQSAKMAIWCVETGQLRSVLGGLSETIEDVSFSPDASLIASIDCEFEVYLHNTSTGQCLQRFDGHSSWSKPVVKSVEFSPDGCTIATSSVDQAFRLWRVDDSDDEREAYRDSVVDWKASRDGQFLATTSFDHRLLVWSMATMTLVHELEGHDEISLVAFSPDSSLIAAPSGDSIRIWNIQTGLCVSQMETMGRGKHRLRFSEDSKQLLVASPRGMRLWELSTESCISELDLKQPGASNHSVEAVSADVTLVALRVGDKFQVWNTKMNQYICDFQDEEKKGRFPRTASFSKDSALLALSFLESTEVRRAADGQLIQRLSSPKECPRQIVFSSDSSLLALLCDEGVMLVWDLDNGHCFKRLTIAKAVTLGSTDPVLTKDVEHMRLSTSVGSIDLGRELVRAVAAGSREEASFLGLGISCDGEWITWNSRKLLRLPVEFRESFTAVIGGKIALASAKTPNLQFIEFLPSEMPF